MAILGDTNIIGDLNVTGSINSNLEGSRPQIVAWCHAELNSSNIYEIKAGYNISSITYSPNSTSSTIYTVNFIHNMIDTYYAPFVSGEISGVFGGEVAAPYKHNIDSFMFDMPVSSKPAQYVNILVIR